MSEKRPPEITHWREIAEDTPWSYAGSDEPMSLGAAFGRHFDLTRIGIHHERLLPGHRSSIPHAESTEDEFVYVISGAPDVWLDGQLHRLKPGDGVGFKAGTGLAHTFLNNTTEVVELLVVGDKTRDDNRIANPLHPERQDDLGDEWWGDVPRCALGPHDGLTDARRAELAKKTR